MRARGRGRLRVGQSKGAAERTGRGRARELSFSAEYGGEFKHEIDANAAELDLTESDVSDGHFYVRCDEHGQAVIDPHFDAHG